MRRWRTEAAAAVVGALALTAFVAPAQAGTIRMDDAVHDGLHHHSGDVKWVRLTYGAHRLKVTIAWPKSGDPAYYQDLYLDTWPKHAGPEVTISSNGDWEGWTVSRGGGWDVSKGTEACSSKPMGVAYDYDHQRIRYSVPRGCLKPANRPQPPRIRASLVTRGETEKDYDWVPGARRFGRWVHRDHR